MMLNVLAKLADHLNSHLGNRPYPCKHCSYRSGTSHTLKRHVLAKHSGECGPSKMPSGLCKRLASS
ncbi:hypothetical protein K435DRAFT_495439 [Dendrothele bispora CBS 962.96]|uniref:C2H2-type domain-containing protein n=1 Tax=Dendrothele bispora (strain CBS 962.96) TaxID=1314807 RepID=A0A4S8KXG7_DENBC|nr:hypothetical protein K435DRAFT_495439 [Dendrothele bispora CBS 962.96]